MELHDIMMIFTTNHLEKIDPAFTRPGRIDYILKLENASADTIKQMIAHKYKEADLSKHAQKLAQINDSIISPADVQMTCLKYGADEIEQCLDELIKKTAII
jgi:ATP-dependent 26S proteasome regulatory subunit